MILTGRLRLFLFSKILFAGMLLNACSAAIQVPKSKNTGENTETPITGTLDLSAIANQNTAEDTPLTNLALTVTSSNNDLLSLITWSATSTNTTLISNSAISTSGSAGSYTVTLTPNANQFGSATITVTATAGSVQDSTTFDLTVSSVNDTPTITNIANLSTNEDTDTSAIAFTIGDAETTANSLSVSVSSSDTNIVHYSNIAVSGSGASRTLIITPETNAFGTVDIDVNVDDGTGLDVTETFTLTVNSVNDAPTISAIANQSIASGGNTGALAFTIGDVETATSSLTLSGSSSNTTLIPNGSIVFGGSNGARTVTATSAANQWGTADITVTVDDGTTTTDEVFQVTVAEPNHSAVTFTYPFKNGLRVGESDDQAFTITGTCTINNLPVRLSIEGAAVSTPPTCSSGTWSLTRDLSSLTDGIITIATTNSTAAKSLKIIKDTAYCTAGRKAASPFAGGTGQPWDPYTICTPTQFQQISNYSTSHIEIRNSLNLSSLTAGEGDFSGTLNGNNFILSNFSINQPATSSIGLFSGYGVNGIFKNIHARNFSITAANNSGLLFGLVYAPLIDNVSATGTLTAGSNIGGIVGNADKGTILRNSYSSVTIAVGGESTGGLVGLAGGRHFRNQSRSAIADTDWYGAGVYFGAGLTNSSIVESLAIGSINSDTDVTAGFGGRHRGEVSDSYSDVAVGGSDPGSPWFTTFIAWDNDAGLLTKNVFSMGSFFHPTGMTNAGGSSSATNGYFNTTSTGQSTGGTGWTGLNSTQFASSTNFTGFDFTNVWTMASDRPQLRWESADTTAPTAPTVTFPSANGYPVSYTDINTIGTYEFEGRCSESEWPLEITATVPSGGSSAETEPEFISCNIDGFWRYVLDISTIDQTHGETVSISIRQIDGSGNASSATVRNLTVNLPNACVSNRAGSPFAAGSGTVGDPWIICTETQWDNIVASTTSNQTGVNVALGDSIDLGGAFTITNLQSRTGSLNGRNFRIRNGVYSGTASNIAFIGVTTGFSISNLHLFDFSLTTTGNHVGAFGATGNSGNLDNVSYRGTVSGGQYVGAILNEGTNIVASNIYVRTSVSASEYAGAFAGSLNYDISVTDSIIRFNSISSSGQFTGGFTGSVLYDVATTFEVDNITLYGNHINSSGDYAGGFIGSINTSTGIGAIQNIDLRVNRINASVSAGGFFANDDAGSGSTNFSSIYIENGIVESTSGNAAGFSDRIRVVGNSLTNVGVSTRLVSSNGDSAGFIREAPDAHSFGNIYSTSATLSTSGSTNSFRTPGGSDTVSNVYYDKRTAGAADSAIGTAKDAADMYRQSTYTGFNFASTWKMPARGGYPKLQWIYD